MNVGMNKLRMHVATQFSTEPFDRSGAEVYAI